MRAVIVGGGIAGLTAAIALIRYGIEVDVLEQAHAPTEIGAGIQIAANGSKVLRALGIEPKIASTAVIPKATESRDMISGRMLWRVPLGRDAEMVWGAPLYNIHRADLIEILANAIPSNALHFSSRLVDFRDDGTRVVAYTEDGKQYIGDFLVGADGIHSYVRQRVAGADQIEFSDILMWRALLTKEELSGIDLPENGNYWYGPGRTLITYWVRPGRLYSVLASVPSREIKRESWEETGDLSEFRNSFQGLEPRAQSLVDRVQTAFITGMFYRNPIPRWSFGRVTLLGDAAHPMVPYLAQGACQGIEDSWVLASMIAKREGRIEDRLGEYEARRRPYTTRVQSNARAIVKMCHEETPARISIRNGQWKGMQRIDPLSKSIWEFVWGHDVILEVTQPAGTVQGLSATREGKRMGRPESQKAFDLWKSALDPESVARGYDGLRQAYDRFLTSQFPVPETAQIDRLELRGITAYQVVSEQAQSSRGKTSTIMHFHGGGYIMGSAASSMEFAYRLSGATGSKVVSVDYRLAPEHPFPAALDDALDAYLGLISDAPNGTEVIFSGESAGAGLALALTLFLKQIGEPLPAGLCLICPFADLTLGSPSIKEAMGEDPAAPRDLLSLMATYYFQRHEPRDPLVSPIYGDFSGLPPVFVTAVEGESLFDDARRVYEKARLEDIEITGFWVRDSVHVYPLFPFLEETKEFMRKISTWINRII